MAKDGWQKEALQLRKNHEEERAQMTDILTELEAMVPVVATSKPYPPNFAKFCLMMHHFGMRFHNVAQKKTIEHMHRSKLEELPKSFGDFGGLDG